MKFYPITTQEEHPEALAPEYQAAREIGVLRLGERCLYFRRSRRVYYIPYSDIRRCFRRVMLVPARLCCGKGDLPVEYLVIHGEAGELAQIQLPGARAARGALEELKRRLPGVEFTCPSTEKEEH